MSMPDDAKTDTEMMRDFIRQAKEPVAIVVPERWLIGKLAQLLDKEAAKLRGQAKRSKAYTATSKLSLADEYEQHAQAIRSQHANEATSQDS